MKDHVLISEFRRRVSVLESKYEALERDLNAARIVLAMLERESVNNTQVAGNFSQAEIIADIAIDALSHTKEMHRADILEAVVSRDVHVGYDDDKKKQLSGLSTLLSKDARFRPVKGRSGYWTLARTDLGWPDSSDDRDRASEESDVVEPRPDDVDNSLSDRAVLTSSGLFRRYRGTSSPPSVEKTA